MLQLHVDSYLHAKRSYKTECQIDCQIYAKQWPQFDHDHRRQCSYCQIGCQRIRYVGSIGQQIVLSNGS